MASTLKAPTIVLCDRLFLCGKSFSGVASWNRLLQELEITEHKLMSLCHGCIFADSAAVLQAVGPSARGGRARGTPVARVGRTYRVPGILTDPEDSRIEFMKNSEF